MPFAPEKLVASPGRMVTLTALKCSGPPTTVGSLVAATTVRVIAGGAAVVCAIAGAATSAALSNTTPKVLQCMITSQGNFCAAAPRDNTHSNLRAADKNTLQHPL